MLRHLFRAAASPGFAVALLRLDLFNNHFYAGELQRPATTVSPDGGHGAYGWCSVYEIWQGNGGAYREINICAEYIDRPISEVAATMLHEALGSFL